ncbi:MAG: NADPH-dependent glutamate synthase [Syntrophomonadaceae bacterium]|nr:NADPH-dependent glutamate synthase [Syntrophomonadaceae bacterium]
MPSQDPLARMHNFAEVALGYSEEDALLEAARCLSCKKAFCQEGCPVDIDIPAFITKIKERDYLGAARKIKEKSNLPAICGRVCPQESQCEKYCIRGKKEEPVAIGRLERFVADYEIAQGKSDGTGVNSVERSTREPSRDSRVAVVGSGPASLTVAGDLARKGYAVTLFEALHVPGGVLMYGIPEFRLPERIVQHEIEGIRQLGVEIQTNVVIGSTITVDQLFQKGYVAVFLGTGAGLPYFMGIPGENLNGVYSANEFLTRVNLMKAYLFPTYLTPIKVGRRVAVLGAGNVAMDAARTARRLGAEEVSIVYRRSAAEMPARHEEIEHAKEEGVQLRLLTNPIEIKGDDAGWVKELVCLRYELGAPDESGRRAPIAIPGSEHSLEVDTVVVAIGQGPNPLITATTEGLIANKRGNIVAGENGETSRPGVFAGGDIVTGAATVILAMGAGKKAAAAIDRYLSEASHD